MDDKKRLPDAELAVMQAIWAVGGEVSLADFGRSAVAISTARSRATAGAPTPSTPTLLACAKKDSSRAAARGGTICTRRSSQRTDTSNLRAAAS